MKVVVVIPTYNEYENVKRLVPALAQVFSTTPQHTFEALFVDGKSTDGTGELLNQLSKTYSFVHVLIEPEKRGLGAAYIFAFKHALTTMAPDALVEMDADFQHDPNDLSRLITKLDEGYDYVIGSRFIKGGGIPKRWEFYRKVLSYGASWFSKIVLGIYDVHDFTSGFKASRVKGFADRLNFDTVKSKGFAYKLELLYQTHKLGAKFCEIPIQFGLRDRGDSKMERDNLLISTKIVLGIRISENKTFFRFVVVGFCGLATDESLANLLRYFGVAPNLSGALAAFIAMFVTFTLNNSWSFGDRPIVGGLTKLRKIGIYYGLSSVPVVVRYYFIGYTTLVFGNNFVVFNLSLGLMILLGLIWNYLCYSRLIWKKDKTATM